ncbi:hypothetical protein B0H10DRAFT_1970819 [Mycena sp. CBHHK59/15]|nr:hypothetical protein B0H10DRAFT_1970819 [Mycena sp. CBHHK59/15]
MFAELPEYKDQFANLTGDNIKELLKTTYKDRFETWQNQAWHTVTARNRLLELYEWEAFLTTPYDDSYNTLMAATLALDEQLMDHAYYAREGGPTDQDNRADTPQ